MPRLIAIEGPESGLALPVVGAESYLSPGPERRVRLSRGGEAPRSGAAIRRDGRGTYRIERVGDVGDEAPALFVNGEAVDASTLQHGDLIKYGGATLIFDCDEVGAADTAADASRKPAAAKPKEPGFKFPEPPTASPGKPAAAGPGRAEAPRAATPRERSGESDLIPQPPFLTPPGEIPLSGESIRYRQKAYDDTRSAIRGVGRQVPPPPDAPRDRLAVLLHITTTVSATLDLGSLLTRLLDVVFEEIPADRGTVLLFDRAAKKLRSMVSKRRAGGEGPVKVSRTIIKEALTAQESILTVDAMTDFRFKDGESVVAAGIRAAMCVPIVRDGRALGVIHLDTERGRGPNAFTRDHLELLTAIASVVALAIENARLYQEAAERERLRTELSLASSIQMRLLPKTAPRTPDLDVCGKTIPAKELGGDIFDFIEDHARQTLHVLVGDVSGKGVGAGLVMAMARSYIRPLAATHDSPKQVLVRANALLYEDTSRDMFMSAVLLRWDGVAKRLTYCGAGQEHILIVRAGSRECESFPAGGVALMMIEEAAEYLEDRDLPLAAGDLVLLYSDGVTDSREVGGRFYGLERLVAALPEIARLPSSQEVVERIAKDVLAFAGEAEQHDDITIVAIRRR